MIMKSVVSLNDQKELLRLASLVGTDARNPEKNFLEALDKIVREARMDEHYLVMDRHIYDTDNAVHVWSDNRIEELDK